MARELLFNHLKPHERDQARKLMRRDFAPVLTGLWENSDASTTYHIQMEVIEAMAFKIFSHRILTACYAAENLLFGGKKLFVHRLEIMIGPGMPQAGTMETLYFPDAELWEITRAAQASERRDCQVLVSTDAMREIMEIPEFRPFLPPKLRNLDLSAITLWSDKPFRRPDGTGRLVETAG